MAFLSVLVNLRPDSKARAIGASQVARLLVACFRAVISFCDNPTPLALLSETAVTLYHHILISFFASFTGYEGTGTGIISNAIANAGKHPPQGQENVSLLQQHSSVTKPMPASTQFTFTCDSQVPGTLQWPGKFHEKFIINSFL